MSAEQSLVMCWRCASPLLDLIRLVGCIADIADIADEFFFLKDSSLLLCVRTACVFKNLDQVSDCSSHELS